jgi:uncharacterized membrane protein YgaE (UPF0421/DUF939 family)
LKKRDFWYRLKRLSKHTGKPQWGLAVRAIILIAIAGLIGKLLGLNNGINAIIIVTLLATIIIDISLPIKKVATLTVLGFLMTILAFISASLGLSNLGLFVFFTVIWSFFSISMYIFGSMEGSLGFTFFLTYFVAVLLVNNQSSTLDWASYSIIAYLVASILFIPKIWLEKKKIHEMVSVGFNPTSSIHNVLYTRNLLSGIPINSNYYDIFKLGSYLKIFRSYSNLINSRLNSKSRLYFKNFLDRSDNFSSKIVYNFNKNKGPVDLTEMDKQLSTIESNFLTNKNYNAIVIEISHSIMEILNKSNEILSKDNGNGIRRIKGTDKPLKEVLKANFNLKNLYIRHAVRFTLAMTISLIFVYLTRERSAIWITMGVLIILKPDITSTIDNLISRVGYNFLAIILAIILSLIFPHDLLIWLALIMLFLFRAFYPNYMGFSIMAMTVFIVLVWPTGTVYDNAIARLVDIALGGVIAFICAYIILPSRVSVNLPDQLIRTIKSNIKYAKHVLIISSMELNTENVSKSFKNYIMEENNLEAGLKKLEDTFKDINDDLELYHELIASNNKMAADLSGIAAILNTNKKSMEDLNINVQKILTTLNYLETSLTKDIKPLKLSRDHNSLDHIDTHKTDELEQLIGWITSDLQLIQKGIDIANETGLLQRYTKLT